MIQRETTKIKASPERVWEVLGDPSRMADFHPKCVRVDVAPGTAWRAGATFRATFRLRDETTCDVRIDRLAPCEVIALEYEIGEPTAGVVYETFTLQPNADATIITHTVDMTYAGLPWWARGLIWLLNRFGHSAGPGCLERLARLVEVD